MNVPPTPLTVMSFPWSFSMWGIDMISMIEPKPSNRHRFILVAIDYFTKWVEAASYTNVTSQVVIDSSSRISYVDIGFQAESLQTTGPI